MQRPLIVVMPAFNEEGCISAVARSWLEVIAAVPESRLIVVDDGSRDRTGHVLDGVAASNPGLIVLHQENGGHGRAVMAGYERALAEGAERIFQTDSDDQIVASEFHKLWARRDESPFILAHRARRRDKKNRLAISWIARALCRVLFGLRAKDPNVPFRLMRRDFLAGAMAILRRHPSFAPNIQLSVLAGLRGIDALDVPVIHKRRETGVESIRYFKLARVCARCAVELISFRLRLSSDGRPAA